MKRLTLAFAITLLTAGAALAQRPITFEDMLTIKRIGAPQVSPDGKSIAYDLSTVDLAANKRRSLDHERERHRRAPAHRRLQTG